MALIYQKICPCCGEEFYVSSPADWKYKINVDGKKTYYCGHKCYSQVFDSKWKASTITRHTSLGYKTDKTLR